MLKGKSNKITPKVGTEVKKKEVQKVAKELDTKAAKKEKKRKIGVENKIAAATKIKGKNTASAKNKKPKVLEEVSKKEVAADPADRKLNEDRPSLRAVYSNKKYTFLPLGFATDFSTQTPIIIFSNLSTGEVHTVALSSWKRWKMKEVKKINTET